jgi:DNA-binding winged helix-turn-helix (wHTH) protein/Tol biopolymer transport system component
VSGATKNDRLIRFSVFELDRESGELFKQGRKVKLQGQPFELLIALLERPAEVLTREELRQRLWPSDTIGDFDHGLNRAINRIREALEDSADTPRFVETLPRRGYRFIGLIQEEHGEALPREGSARMSAQAAVGRPEEPKPKPRKSVWMSVAIAATVVAAGLGTWMALHRANSSGPIRIQQLTTNSAENPVWHAVISPDGKYLAYGDSAGIKVRLISTGESHLLPRPQVLSAGDAWFPAAWLPDGTRILANSITGTGVTAWTVSVMGGKAVRLRENALVQSVSPDASLIAFTTGEEINLGANAKNEIWVMGPRGEKAKRIIKGDGADYFDCVQWSPDSDRIAYLRFSKDSPDHVLTKQFANYTLESSDMGGGTRTAILSNQPTHSHAEQNLDSFTWAQHGRILYTASERGPSSGDTNLWEIAVDSKTGKARGSPRRLTDLAGLEMDNLSVTTDGKRLVFESVSDQSHVYVGRVLPGGNLETPRRLTLEERHNSPFAWTPDSKAVIFRSDRTGTGSIYKQALDENEPELVPTGPDTVKIVRVSPNAKWLVYLAVANPQPANKSDLVRIMRVPLAGGAPEMIFETSRADVDLSCAHRAGAQCLESERSADGKTVVFFGFDPMEGRRNRLFEIGMPGDKSLNPILSPDGSRIALTGTDPRGRIEIRSLTGRIENTIEVPGWPSPLAIDWDADGNTLIVSHFGLIGSPSGPIGTTLLRVDLEGHVQPLWETRGGRFTWGITSPDGKHLAIREPAVYRNAWMVENF